MSVIGNRMNRRTFAVVTFSFVLVSFWVLGISTTENCAQGFECGDPLCENRICIDLDFGLMNEYRITSSEYDFSEPFPEGLYLVLENVTIINNDGIEGESKNTSNMSIDIDVHPIGAEKIHVAEIIVPPLDTNDTYEITLLGEGTTRYYEYKLNGEPIKTESQYIHLIKLSVDGWWQIDIDFKLLNPVGISEYSHRTIINGEIDDYFFKVYSEYEIANLKIAENNIKIARWNIGLAGFILFITLISILLQHKRAVNHDKNFKELIDELKESNKKNINGKTKRPRT